MSVLEPGFPDAENVSLPCSSPHLQGILLLSIYIYKPTPVFLPGKFHRQRNLAGYSPWDRKESDTTEHISMHTHTHTHTHILTWLPFPKCTRYHLFGLFSSWTYFSTVQFSHLCLSAVGNKCFPVPIIEMHIFPSICIGRRETPASQRVALNNLPSRIEMRTDAECQPVMASLGSPHSDLRAGCCPPSRTWLSCSCRPEGETHVSAPTTPYTPCFPSSVVCIKHQLSRNARSQDTQVLSFALCLCVSIYLVFPSVWPFYLHHT